MSLRIIHSFFIISLFLFFVFPVFSQEKKTSFNGYVKYLHTIAYQDIDGSWYTDNLIHNRLNFSWFPTERLTFSSGIRNRFMYGDNVKFNPNLPELIDDGSDFLDLTFIPFEGNSYLFTVEIDRLYFDYMVDKWQFRIGKQRINWGQNLVWNPNDVFNAYSYFDFDYEERPGTDAIKVAYYPNYSSTVEIIYQFGETVDDMSFAGLYRFNKWKYDIQFLGGYVKQNIVLGTGWSGNIKGAAFRGEFTYFNFDDTSGTNTNQLIWSVSADYTFKNQLYIQGSYIYNNVGSTADINLTDLTYFRETSAKNLTLSRGEIFWQVSYPVTPLTLTSLAGIVNPYDGSFFVGPSGTVSLRDDLELLFMAQLFFGQENTLYGDIGKLWYGRLRWSF